ncbi:MAG: TonB family protein [Polyangiaceae bacterium]|nr:TonB family protein [Polyangiaceae bacterium]
MTREVSIPLFLWVSAAIVLHAIFSGGAAGATFVEEKLARERASIRSMVSGVRGELETVYVDVGEGSEKKKDDEQKPVPEEENPLLSMLAPVAEALSPLVELPEQPVAEEEKKAEEQPKPEEEEKAEEKKPEDPKKPELVILKDKRISIRQAQDEDEKDNPNAPRLAEKAHTVEDETQSRIQSSDQVSKNPSPGSNQRGPTDKEGNSDKTKIASAEEAPGDPKRAPGESAENSPESSHVSPQPPTPSVASRPPSAGQPGPASTSTGATPAEKQPTPATPGSVGGAGPAAPPLVTADEGYSAEVPEAAPGGAGVGVLPGTMRPAMPGSVASLVPKMPGLGVQTGEAGKVSLPWSGFVAAVGEDQLDKERAAAGQKVRSEHAGRYDTKKFERWLPDIVNYDPSVKLGNQTSLNAAQSPFATYLSTIHNAIHPIFAEEFLGLLNSLPRGHQLNDNLVTHVEIILSRAEGKVLKMGITKQSGSTMFDAAALEAIDRAQPFGAAPEVIASSDGNVYLHWEFHRDPIDACSNRNAKPFIVKDPKPLKKTVPLQKKPKQPKQRKEGSPSGKTTARQNAGQPGAPIRK